MRTLAKDFSRRDFLGGTGRLALTAGIATQMPWLAGFDRHPHDPQPTGRAWRQLARELDGRLLRPGDRGYTATRLPWNMEFADTAPAGVAVVANASDVQTCVRWAREEGLPAVARSGGHSYAGYSTTKGLLVDLRRLDSVSVESSGVASIGAGAPLGIVENRLAPRGILLPAGRCATVGIAGLVLGGGFGFSARPFGLTSDNLVETAIVTADGELRRASEREHRDLFWACRGGGGGNFGINVGFRFRTYRVDEVSVYQISWSPDDAVAVWSAMQEIDLGAPDEFSMRIGVSIGEDGPLPGARNLSVETIGQYIGPASELRELLAPAIRAARPLAMTIEELSLADATAFLAQESCADSFFGKSAYLAESLPERAIEALMRWMRRYPPGSRTGGFRLFSWGGAINDVPADATAFVHRSEAFVAEYDASWHPGDSPAVVAASREWVQGLSELLGSRFTGSAYQNFIDPTLRDWQEAYYGENFRRLVHVKTRVDPDDFFHFAQSIPTRRRDLGVVGRSR